MYTELVNLVEVSVRADGEAAEAVSELFNRLGRGGAVIEEMPDGARNNLVVRTYLVCDEQIDANRRSIEEGIWHLAQLYPIPAAEFRDLKEEDWADAWKSFHPVQHVGERIVLVPTWREYEPQSSDLLVHLDPGMAFGTGQHPTTRLCLLALEQHARAGMRVLDVGTGSGILSIAAARLGAQEILACDIDPLAVQVARENITLNQLSQHIRLVTGSLGDVEPSGLLQPERGAAHWDLIIINILAPVIIQLLPRAKPLLKPGGRLVLSGLIDTQEEDVRAAVRDAGLAVVERQQDDDWVMLLAA